MKLVRSLALLLAGAATAAAAPTEIIAVKAGRLIDPRAGVVIPGAVVVIENGRVKAVGPALAIPPGAKVIDLSAMTVLPGLIDFTTVRDVGTYRAFVDVAMREAIEKGYFPGPHMYVAGAYLTITGGGGAMSGDLAPDIGLPWDLRFGVADGVDQVRQRVRDIAQHGVDLIKLLATGAFLAHGSDPHAVEYSYDEMRAAVEEAAHKGLKVAAHAHSTPGIKDAVRAGVASIEHGTYIDDEGLRLMKEHGTYLVADIYDAEYIRQGKAVGIPSDFAAKQPEGDEIQRENFRKAVKTGVKIAFGTDASVYPHGLNARQFAWQVKYGQTPMEAIRSSTVSAADLIGRGNDAGSLEPGKWADLIAVKGDPLADVRVLENVAFVMKGGKVYKDAR